MTASRRKFWGWGVEDADLTPAQQEELARTMAQRFGVAGLRPGSPPRVEELTLPTPRVKPPEALAALCTTDPYERAGHTYGKSFRDVVRAYARDFSRAPDMVALPRSEEDVVRLLDWCGSAGIAAIPYGGGSSVVGGTEPDVGDGYAGTVSIDLRHLDRLLDVDENARAAQFEAGIYGPALEAALKPRGMTLRHFPQSFEFSTLGGWIATRSGGHYATLYTHIDDFVENLRVVTPSGTLESFRVPGSGAGPSPDRLFIGSEGALGIITAAWMRLQHRPTFRANATVTYPDLISAAQGVRAIAQAGLYPANLRVIDNTEALNNGVADGSVSVLILGFESADHPVDAWMARAIECAQDAGGRVAGGLGEEGGNLLGMAGSWREAFIRMPYVRDALVGMGILFETFETAITWDRFPEFHEDLVETTRLAAEKVCGRCSVSTRFTHAYPDGPAPYYSVTAPAKPGSMLQQWEEIKAAASEVLLRHGATITHHHAVGRDHMPWYTRQRPEGFGRALAAAKGALDPRGVLNPGVLVPHR